VRVPIEPLPEGADPLEVLGEGVIEEEAPEVVVMHEMTNRGSKRIIIR
jgi:hypothetical protein